MGILDDLREEASHKQVEQQEDIVQKEKLEHNYRMLLLPGMHQLFSYFKELTDYLSVIETPLIISHYSSRYPELGELYQTDYKLSTDKHGGIADFDKLTEITLRFYCLGQEEELLHYCDNKIAADQEKEFLSSHKIPFQYDQQLGNTKGGAVTFHITRKIPVYFKFTVDYEKSGIILEIQNHEDFEQRTQVINPDQINESYMDKLARYILRKDTEFLRMDIDDTHKENIRRNIEQQQQSHAEELKAARIKEENEQKAAQEAKVSNRVKTFFNQMMDKSVKR